MIAEPDISPFPEKVPSPFEGRDFSAGVEIDDSQEWIGELLAERIRRIDAGEMKMYSLEEFETRLEELCREKDSRR